MAIEIIQRGTLPGERQHQTRCGACQTIFSFGETDARRISDQRDGDYLTLPCPVCQRPVNKAVHSPYPREADNG